MYSNMHTHHSSVNILSHAKCYIDSELHLRHVSCSEVYLMKWFGGDRESRIDGLDMGIWLDLCCEWC